MKTTVINMGPQHPAVHGVLRLVVESRGEIVSHSTCEIGLLHRGTEKLCEYMEYYKILPFFSRFDYVGTLSGEQLYSVALEKLLKVNMPYYSQLVSTLLAETIRISSHLLALTAMAMDTGAITPFLWAFEESEELCQLYELLSGARMHTALMSPGGVNCMLTHESISLLLEIIARLPTKLDEVNDLFKNPMFISRLENIGFISDHDALKLAFSGPVRRAGGRGGDLSASKPYDAYLYRGSPVEYGTQNDCLGRYKLRMAELHQSMATMSSLVNKLLPYFKLGVRPQLYTNSFKMNALQSNPSTMEGIIHSFKAYSEGFHLSKTKGYTALESPRGRYGVTLAGGGLDRPCRVKLRSPTYYHLQGLNTLVTNDLVSNVLTILGSLDVVMGEVDK